MGPWHTDHFVAAAPGNKFFPNGDRRSVFRCHHGRVRERTLAFVERRVYHFVVGPEIGEPPGSIQAKTLSTAALEIRRCDAPGDAVPLLFGLARAAE